MEKRVFVTREKHHLMLPEYILTYNKKTLVSR